MDTRAPVSGPAGREAARPRDWLRERAGRVAVAVAVGAALLRLGIGARLPIFPDEAYYWEWSRRLAAGYFDHPPGIAFLIRGGTLLWGVTPAGVRLLVALAGLIASLFVLATAGRISGAAAALRASLVLACMPLAGAGLVLATPDVPLLLAAALAFYAVVRALEAPAASMPALGWWIAAGAACGIGLLSKYTAVLIPLGALVGLLAAPTLRARLRGRGPWLAAALAALLFLPVVGWNAAHGWASFRFQLGHGLGAPRGSTLSHEAELLGGQIGLVSPVLFALMAVAVARALRRGEPAVRLLAAAATTSLGFFALSALRKPVEANWPALAYVPAAVVVAVWATTPRRRRWLSAGCVVGAALVAVVYVQALTPILPVRPGRDPVARAFGWDAIAVAAAAAAPADVAPGPVESSTSASAHVWFAGLRYQDAAELAIHLPEHPAVFCIALDGRPTQYDLWPGFPESARPGDDLVLALPPDPAPHPVVTALAPYFASVAGAGVAMRSRGGPIDGRRVYVLRGWTGRWPAALRREVGVGVAVRAGSPAASAAPR